MHRPTSNPARSHRSLIALTCLALGTASHADWPQYRGADHNGTTRETIPAAWPAAGPRVVWKVPSPGGFSSFAVAGGRAFTLILRDIDGASRECLVAHDANTGRELWIAPLTVAKYDQGGNKGADSNDGGDGPRSTPAADASRVYAFSSKLVLQCFDAATGREVWTRDLIKDHAGRNISWQNAQSPAIDGDLIYAAGGGPDQSLLAIRKSDGSIAWKGFDEKMTHATPVATTLHGQRQVIFFVQSGLLSVDAASGKELWRYQFPYKVSAAASPVVSGDIVYCSAGYDVGAGAVRVSRDGSTWTATEIYRKAGNRPLANHWSTPVASNGFLYGMFQFKEYGSGPVKCVDVKTGDVRWEKSGFGPGHLILAGKHLLALSDDGQLVVVEARPDAYKETARADVLEGKCWTTPVLSNGRVFARSTREAVCIEISPGPSGR